MKEKKLLPIIVAVILIGVSFFSGCIRPFVIDTYGWDHIDEEGTAVKLWGHLDIIESADNWNEGFVWDTDYHKDWQEYQYRDWADNHYGLGLFSINIENLTRTTTYHYRAFGEYLKGQNQYGVGADFTFIPGGPRVITDNASNIGLTGVTLNGNLWHMGGASSCEVYFLYGDDEQDLNIQTIPEILTNTGLFSAALTDLMSNTTYYFKAVAKNDAYTWAGIIRSVTPGQPVVVTRQPGEIGKNHAILKGELWNTGGTTDCNVWFIYSDDGPDNLNLSTTPQTMNTTGPFQAYIGNLSPTTRYWYRTVANNGVAQGLGDIYEFTTTPTSEIRTTGILGKPYIPPTKTIGDTLISKITTRYLSLLEKHPMLLKLLLQQPRIRALLMSLK